jgi:phosphoglycolate phosphatase-like HAD superfamily hydrolase
MNTEAQKQLQKTYSSWVFDCDGVILDSNKAKANAFYAAALRYGEHTAEAIRTYHMNNGGISRFTKFRYVFEMLLGRTEYEDDYQLMIRDFSQCSKEELKLCKPVSGVREFLQSAPKGTKRFVVSGAEEEELKWCLEFHGLAQYFDGIYGSPKAKPEILASLIKSNLAPAPAIYFGDSKYDFESATASGYDFVFVSEATDYADWRNFVKKNCIFSISNFCELNANSATPVQDRWANCF